jgi:hypothetical protein
MQEAPIINIILHSAVFGLSIIAGFFGLGLWYNRTINHLAVSTYWRIFIIGIIFYAVSEFADIFTPGLTASIGMHNLTTEMTLLIGLALIFTTLHRFLRDYIKKDEK